jgi:hypothetical protein
LDLKLFHAVHTAWIWHCLASGGLLLSRNILKECILHVMKFKLHWENGLKNTLNNSTATGLKILFIADGVVLK